MVLNTMTVPLHALPNEKDEGMSYDLGLRSTKLVKVFTDAYNHLGML